MRISDWSSDVCSSDLGRRRRSQPRQHLRAISTLGYLWDAGVDRKYGFLGSDRPSHEQALLHCRRRSRNLTVASQRLSRPIMDRKYHDKKIAWAGRGREWIRREYR